MGNKKFWTKEKLSKIRDLIDTKQVTCFKELAKEFDVSIPTIHMVCSRNKISLPIPDVWTVDKLDELKALLPRMTNKQLKLHFGISTHLLNLGLSKINLNRDLSMSFDGYMSQQQLLSECKKRGYYLTKAMLAGFQKSNIIQSTKLASIKDLKTNKRQKFYFYSLSDNNVSYFSQKDTDLLFSLFNEYEMFSQVKKRLAIPIYWLSYPEIKTKRFPNYKNVFLHKESIKFFTDLLTNYLTIDEFAKQVYYSRAAINGFIKKGFITKRTFADKTFINKNFILKVKSLVK